MIEESKFIPIESILNIYDEERVWYYIPGFNGYELSNDGLIRSMKHYKKYPYGILIRSNDSGYYILSNDNNERTKIHYNELYNLAQTNPRHITGYPRKTYITDKQSRNQRIFINKEKKEKFDTTPRAVKFTIIDKII